MLWFTDSNILTVVSLDKGAISGNGGSFQYSSVNNQMFLQLPFPELMNTKDKDIQLMITFFNPNPVRP